MCKTTNYRAGGWRRDLLRDELTNISPSELRDLGAAARVAQDQLLKLYRQSRTGAEANRGRAEGGGKRPVLTMRPSTYSVWGRKVHFPNLVAFTRQGPFLSPRAPCL